MGIVLLALWCGVAGARKPSAVADAPEAPSAACYRKLRPQVAGLVEPLQARAFELLLPADAEKAEAQRVALVADAGAAADIAAELPSCDGDTGLADAAGEHARTLASVAEELPALWALFTTPPFDDADVINARALYPSLAGRLETTALAWRDADLAFASQHGARFLTVEVSRSAPTFEAPDGIVPPGSPMPAELVVRIAAAYRAELVGRADELSAVHRAWREANGAEAARAESLAAARAALDTARSIPAFQGDASLRNATVAVGVAVLADIAGARSEEGAARFAAAVDAWSVADHEFDVRWALSAYEDWLRTGPRRP